MLDHLSFNHFSVALLLDGGDFIAEIPEVETADLEEVNTQLGLCTATTLEDIFVSLHTCPVDTLNIVDKKGNDNELSSVEELEAVDKLDQVITESDKSEPSVFRLILIIRTG